MTAITIGIEMVKEKCGSSYFFLYPLGHFGFTAVTFFEVFPFRQVIVVFLGATTFISSLVAASGCLKLMANCGEE